MTKETMLRDYQLEMLDRLHQAWEKHQSVMVQMPTGVGKTVLLGKEIKNEELRMKNSRTVEKPRVFDPRGRVSLTPSGEIVLTL